MYKVCSRILNSSEMNSRTCLVLSSFNSVGKLSQSKNLIPRLGVNPLFTSSAVRLKQSSNQNELKATEISSLPKKKLAVRFVESFPLGAQPYLRVARVDRPIGSWLLFWPCGWSICLAAPAGQIPNLQLLAIFGLGSMVMRGGGCTINDMWDRKIDSLVQRTRDRPLASGQISFFDALTFLCGQLGLGLLILLQLDWYSVMLGASSMGLVVLYPIMKRLTHYPQLVLGLVFNWGALLGWSSSAGGCDWSMCLPLYLAGICWTMIYDTIYAHQDKYDDIIIGVHSTAIKFGEQTPVCLSCFATTMGLNLAYVGWMCEQTWPYYASVLGVMAHISHQIYTLDINDGDDCARKFASNRWVGLYLFIGCFFGTLLKDSK